eukprot:s3851_g8.t1
MRLEGSQFPVGTRSSNGPRQARASDQSLAFPEVSVRPASRPPGLPDPGFRQRDSRPRGLAGRVQRTG